MIRELAEKGRSQLGRIGTRTSKKISRPPSSHKTLLIDFDEMMKVEYPELAGTCREITLDLMKVSDLGDYANLSIHSPGLDGFDWGTYIRLSEIRIAKAASSLRANLPVGARVMDFGSYFGNASLLFKSEGFSVSAVDSYQDYAPALVGEHKMLSQSKIEVLDSSEVFERGIDLKESFAAVVCLGVIEHIPHSPRALLNSFYSWLQPGGILVLDTPNHAYVYNREKLAQGLSVHAPIRDQFLAPVPFEGHHREYTLDEVAWMVSEVGFEILETDMFNYSLYSSPSLTGDDYARYEQMLNDSSKRELIYLVAQRPI